MITNFKIYENKNKPIFNVGDYVMFLNVMHLKDGSREPTEMSAKIIEKFKLDANYYTLFKNGENYKVVSERSLIRMLTPEELEQFKMEEEANKFNL
jgi:hypothetical protein